MQWSCLILQVKTELQILLLGSATGLINLFNIKLTDVFKTEQCWSAPRITQIGLDVLKTVKRSDLHFRPTLYNGNDADEGMV